MYTPQHQSISFTFIDNNRNIFHVSPIPIVNTFDGMSNETKKGI